MNLTQIIFSCQEKVNKLLPLIPIKELSSKIEEIDEKLLSPGLWNNPIKASSLMKERQKISDQISIFSKIQEQTFLFIDLLNSFPEDLESLQDQISYLYNQIITLETELRFSDPLDSAPAILTINAGAGGLEAANWVSILARMYLRYADSNSYQLEILDEKHSEEHSDICTDSISIRIEGPYAYGHFKNETGVHRLIRNSPFNANDARHTSFAAIFVTPDIEDSIDIKIEDKDLEITAQRSSGSGGQNTNKVSSAVRLKHFPSNINILVRSSRDFHANKKTALKMLKAKLYDLELKKKNEEYQKTINSQQDNAFGHQIRTYTLTPYSLVKDHRSGFTSNNVESFLDGNIKEALLSNIKAI